MHAKGFFVLSIAIIMLGAGWLLTAWNSSSQIDWIWTLALATVGLLTFVVSGGLDKVSVVVGPFFMVSSGLSILRQSGTLTSGIELPVLVISLGVLMLLAQLPVVPPPKWLTLPEKDR